MRKIIQLGGHQRLIEGKHGFFVYNLHDHYVGRALELYGEYSEDEMALFSALVSVGGDVIEVGANIGAHTVPLAKVVQDAMLHAFEPQPVVFQNLCANLSINCCENVLAWPFAVGGAPGRLSVPNVNYADHGNFGAVSLMQEGDGFEVSVITLDDYARNLESVCLLKVDVEGMEREVILGARETIKRLRPVLYVENDRVGKSKALIEVCWEMGYRLYWHTPMLYNPENYFHNTDNIYKNIAAFNMLCIPDEAAIEIRDGILITDSNYHPLSKHSANAD